MKQYANRGGNSNVQSYEIGNDFIAVKFNGTSKIYVYSYANANSTDVERAKQLAESGSGLNSYIMLNMKNDFER
jgi:hypothetical protein